MKWFNGLKNNLSKAEENISYAKDSASRLSKGNSRKEKKSSAKKIGIALLLVLATFSIGFLTQFVQEYAETQSINFDTLTYNPIICIINSFNFKYSGYLWIIFLLLAVITFLKSFQYKDSKEFTEIEIQDERGFAYSSRGDYGTNLQMTRKEMEECFDLTPNYEFPSLEEIKEMGTYYEKLYDSYTNLKEHTDSSGKQSQTAKNTNEFILDKIWKKKEDIDYLRKISDQTILGQEITPSGKRGRIITWNKRSRLNPNIIAVGSPGSMKTRCLANNFILQALRRGESVVAIDTKGSLYKKYNKMGEKLGYKVKILNLDQLQSSDGWNPLANLTSTQKIQILCDTIITNTTGDSPDHFFDQAEKSLLMALVTYVCVNSNAHYIEPSKKNLPYVYQLLCEKTNSELKKMFKELSEKDPSHPALLPWKVYLKAGTKLTPNFQLGLCNRLQLLQIKEVQDILATDDIRTVEIGKTPTLLFLKFKDTDSTYEMISSLFLSFLYIDLVNFADSRMEQKLPVKVNMLLDEFCNAGEIVDVTRRISTIRSRGIVTIIIIQSIPQIQNRYPKGKWAEIMGDCDTLLFLGCGNEDVTPKFISFLSGEATICVQNRGKLYSEIGATISDQNTTNKRAVYTPGEVKSLNSEQELIFLNGSQVLKCWKYDSIYHPDEEYIVESNPLNHIPIRSDFAYESAPIEEEIQETSLKYAMQNKSDFYKPKASKNQDNNAHNQNNNQQSANDFDIQPTEFSGLYKQ